MLPFNSNSNSPNALIKSTVLLFMLIVFFCCVKGALALAESREVDSEMIEDERDHVEKVKRRLYLGGVDEEPLKVQIPLPVPVRKYFSVEGEPAQAESSDD